MSLTTVKEFLETANPTPAEEALIAGCRNNGECILGDGTLPPEGKPQPDRHIRAELIRLIALGGTPDCGLDPSGIWLQGVHIMGMLDLSYLKTRGQTVLNNCRFDEEPRLANAELAELSLSGSHLPGLFAQGINVKGNVFLRKLTAKGTVDLNSANVGGQLDSTGADLDGNNDDALNADGVDVTGPVFLTELSAKGTVRLVGAKIGGQLACVGADLDGKGQEALVAQGMKVSEGLFFRKLKSVQGQVNLDSSHVGDLVDDADSWPKEKDQISLNGFTYDVLAVPPPRPWPSGGTGLPLAVVSKGGSLPNPTPNSPRFCARWGMGRRRERSASPGGKRRH